MYVNGKPKVCSRCQGPLIFNMPETWDEYEDIFVGDCRCQSCGAGFIYARYKDDEPKVSASLFDFGLGEHE